LGSKTAWTTYEPLITVTDEFPAGLNRTSTGSVGSLRIGSLQGRNGIGIGLHHEIDTGVMKSPVAKLSLGDGVSDASNGFRRGGRSQRKKQKHIEVPTGSKSGEPKGR
jgi:hypothetical protein